MNLYEIDNALIACVTVDEDTGEATVDTERLEALQMERNTKIENIALYIKNLKAEAAAIAAEVKNLTDRKRAAQNKADRLTEYLAGYLSGEKFRTHRCTISYRKAWSVDITDPAAVPDEFVKIERTPSKSLIGDAIKNGVEVPGAERVQRTSMTIK